MTEKREIKGIHLVARKGVVQIDSSFFLVQSQSRLDKKYEVRWERNRWVCNCEDYTKHRSRCKHIYAVNYYLMMREVAILTERLDKETRCPRCNSSCLIKKGIRYNRSGPVQRYQCKICERKFTDRLGLGMKSGSATNIIAALDLYYRGLSLRQIAQHLKSTYDIRVSHATVYNWIKKYVKLINEHVRAIQINASERWHADDTLIKVHGRHLVLWALLDSETRFLIAVHISQMRGSDDAQKLMNEGFERSKNKPLELITDGLPSYSIALQNENRKNCGDLMIHLQGPLTEAMNNKMERFFGTLKSRLKTMCRFQNEETAKRFAEGFWFYYNFIKSHKALGGKSPAEKAGIAKDKSWLKWVMGSIKPV